jgi:hypothetical protein
LCLDNRRPVWAKLNIAEPMPVLFQVLVLKLEVMNVEVCHCGWRTWPTDARKKKDMIYRLMRTNCGTRPTGYNATKHPKTPISGVSAWKRVSSSYALKESESTHQAMQAQGEPPSSSLISCCNTMEYTLAFSRVKTVAVLRSRPRNESRISTDGFAASSARIPESYSLSVCSVHGINGRI